jgi:predicted RNA-binding Zn-ribbon protein involved in translation (DUF1610 family)
MTETNAQMLPCPFCGSIELLRRVGAEPNCGWGFVRCDYCDAEGPDTDNFPGGWNARAASPELTSALAREAGLRVALESLAHHPAFDRRYISKDLAEKLDAARAALESKT